ncbi:hypothetical protein [Jidongwangia harbinensis]|uniref:hypothetical protein n=1 Tax=Jidongwangia harbinensis TaxID=2878561 RepID=UPI001CD91D4A|nr:hypothetical protein [Jidongwangia harbinensis]MCA2211673.1 hypothetical protein [Jidongwangia harbinensis]
MERTTSVIVALAGLAIVILNRRFGRVAITNSREIFGRDIRKGTREYRVMVLYSRTLAVIVGSLMLILGTLDALMIDYRGAF